MNHSDLHSMIAKSDALHFFNYVILINMQSFIVQLDTILSLRFVKAGILAISNSGSTKKCNPPPILPTIQVSLYFYDLPFI